MSNHEQGAPTFVRQPDGNFVSGKRVIGRCAAVAMVIRGQADYEHGPHGPVALVAHAAIARAKGVAARKAISKAVRS